MPKDRNEYMKEWRAKNPDKVRAIQKKYYDTHTESISATRKKYYRIPENREIIIARSKAWAKAHPEAVRAHAKRRYCHKKYKVKEASKDE